MPEETHNPLKRMKRNIKIGKRRTSVNIENYLWENLERIAAREGQSVDDICTRISESYSGKESLPAVIRFVTHEVAREANKHLYSGPSGKSDKSGKSGKSRKSPKAPKTPSNSGAEWSDNPHGLSGYSPFEIVLARLRKL